jgi:hypothetical protein
MSEPKERLDAEKSFERVGEAHFREEPSLLLP